MKIFNFIIFIFSFYFIFVSCDNKKTSQEIRPMQKDTINSNELAHVDYVCPMDCEKGKTYHEVGKCPVCKMDLIIKEHTEDAEHDHYEGDGHDHKEGDDHDHKDGDSHKH